jgi:hypothetical protein
VLKISRVNDACVDQPGDRARVTFVCQGANQLGASGTDDLIDPNWPQFHPRFPLAACALDTKFARAAIIGWVASRQGIVPIGLAAASEGTRRDFDPRAIEA